MEYNHWGLQYASDMLEITIRPRILFYHRLPQETLAIWVLCRGAVYQRLLQKRAAGCNVVQATFMTKVWVVDGDKYSQTTQPHTHKHTPHAHISACCTAWSQSCMSRIPSPRPCILRGTFCNGEGSKLKYAQNCLNIFWDDFTLLVMHAFMNFPVNT